MGFFKKAGGAIKGLWTGPALEIAEKAGDLFEKAGKTFSEAGAGHTGKREFELQMEELVTGVLERSQERFFNFFLAYEGKASELPTFLVILRGSVRPILTYALAGFWLWSYIYIFTKTGLSPEDQVWLADAQALLFKLNLLSLGFWYGEKLLTRSGLADMFRKKDA